MASLSQASGSLSTLVQPDWAERGALIGVMGDGRRGAHRRGRELRPAARPFYGRGRVCGCGRLPAQGRRLSPPRAACPTRLGARHRVIHRRGAGGEPGHALRLREHRLRPHPHPRRRRRRGEVPDRGNRGIPGARRRARSRRRGGFPAAVLRADDDGRHRRFRAPRLDRRPDLPQRSVGRVHGCRVPGQPLGRAGRRRARLPLTGGDR